MGIIEIAIFIINVHVAAFLIGLFFLLLGSLIGSSGPVTSSQDWKFQTKKDPDSPGEKLKKIYERAQPKA